MDVHRARFVPFQLHAISALAFSRASDSGYPTTPPALRLALGRADGSLEIWNPLNGLWVQEAVFPGDDKSIDALVWTQEPDETVGVEVDGSRAAATTVTTTGALRLFSIASSPAVTEWDLELGQPKRRSTGNFSEVWCFAAQPRWRPQKNSQEGARSQDIVAGCGDGTVVLLSTAEGDLQFKRYLARVSGKKARCMCLTYQNRDVAIAGFADSVIRVYDTRNGALLRNMSLGVGIPGAPRNALVWQVKCLPNGDIVSADSNGEVRFWDGKNYSLVQRISGHETDCLDLVVSNDGKSVFSGSIDGRMALYRVSANQTGRKTWSRSNHRKVHDGEVKAMAAFDSKGMSVVVSGGGDVTPIATPLREHGKENLRTLSALPQESPVASAPRARLLVSWWDRSISIWRMAKHTTLGIEVQPARPRKLVARVNLLTKEKLRHVAISSDGRLLAAATSSELKVFQLRKRMDVETLAIRKLELPSNFANLGGRALCFSPDGKWLAAATPDNELHVARVTFKAEKPKLLQVVAKTVELERRSRKLPHQTGLSSYDRTINHLAFADDSSVLVASDISGYIDSWALEGHEDLTAPVVDTAANDSRKGSSVMGSDSGSDSDSSDDENEVTIFHGQHWTDNPASHLLPKVDSSPLVVTFRPRRAHGMKKMQVNGNPGVHATRHNPHAHSHQLPQGQHNLFVITAKHQMYEFDILAGRLSDWSRRNPTAVLPDEFKKLRDRVVGAVWDITKQHERIWLYGPNWTFMLNVGIDLGDPDQVLLRTRRRRRHSRGSEAANERKRWKANSGAGGQAEDLRVTAASTSLLPDPTATAGAGAGAAVEDDEDEAEAETGLHLARLRSSNHNDNDDADANVDADADVATKPPAAAVEGEQRKWWISFKYRPILGMVSLSPDGGEADDDDDNGTDEQPLEVVMVERPVWEARNATT